MHGFDINRLYKVCYIKQLGEVMKIVASTAAVCIVIGASVFTTQKVVQAEARKTRNSMPGMLHNPLDDGESLIAKIEKLNNTLDSINKRLTRLEGITGREAKAEKAEMIKATTGIKQEVQRLAVSIDTLAKEQSTLSDLPLQLRTIDANIRTTINAKDEKTSAPPEEILQAMDWMIQKIDDIDGYFPPLYNFLGAVYEGDEASADYPSVDLRLNKIIQMLEKIQTDSAATRKLVTPYNIEPSRYPRPFEERESNIIPQSREIEN